MGSWQMSSHRENAVQEEDSLHRPRCQIRLCSYISDIILYFLKYIFDARRDFHPLWNGKTHPRSNSRRMIRILPKNHYLDRIKGGYIKGTKNIFLFWEAHLLTVFIRHKRRKFVPIRLIKLRAKNSLPR